MKYKADNEDEAMDKAADSETIYEEEEPMEATAVDDVLINKWVYVNFFDDWQEE